MADVSITSPEAGATYSADDTITIKWDDDGDSPDLDSVSQYNIVLCTGPNSDIEALGNPVEVSKGETSYAFTVDASVGASGLYYFQIYATLSDGGHTIHYSPRFTLSDMTGSKAASGSGDPPDSEVSDSSGGTTASDISASFTVPYTAQTGKTRYAPMQTQPGSTVTATTWSRKFDTSSVSYYYTSISPSPVVHSTVTPGWSYTMSSVINYATPAPFPSVLGWYPASKRLVAASKEANNKRRFKKRRWDD
ncbi:unnamed protein product [Ambrosiozyma monospora]|uniref:Unnamed protein product n=1 Tax=Ambrosiozyma monospora TaxID=43982 RepID=A0A9W6Z105_AMBMO|nr:unnamed protein product [Ambrosiozyma monospora]